VVDETTAAKVVADPSSLDEERHCLGIALADALMTRPVDLDAETVAALRAAFTPAELLELTLDVMKWNAQKPAVALGVDDEVRPGELTDLVFDEAGNWVRPT
jgi:hypothetical protein